MSSLSLLRHPFARITGARGKWAPVLAWTLLSVFVALLARRHDHSVDSALSRGFGAVSMPLLVFALFGLVCPEGTLSSAARPLVFLGAPARRAAFAVASAVVGLSALVCALLAAVCVASKRRTGLYTSPHLVSFRERIRLGPNQIPEEHVAEGLEKIRDIIAAWDRTPTFFEVTTALARNSGSSVSRSL